MDTKPLKTEFKRLFETISEREKGSNKTLRKKTDLLKVKLLLLDSELAERAQAEEEDENGN